MKPAPFEYERAESVEEALELLARYGDDAKVIAGGQSLGPLLNLRLAQPRVLVDVNRVAGLDELLVGTASIEIGATCRQRAVERDVNVAHACPLLAQAVAHIGHVAIRNRGTVAGSLAHADPAAELPAVLAALGGRVIVLGPSGTRSLSADELFVMPLVTSLRPEELIIRVEVPVRRARTGQAWLEVARREGDFALAGVAASVELDPGGLIRDVRLAFCGVGPVPIDGREWAALLIGERPSTEGSREVAAAASQACETGSDGPASAAYRRRLVRVLTERALDTATAQALEGASGS